MSTTITRDNSNSIPHYHFALAGKILSLPIDITPPREDNDTTPSDCCEDCLVLPAFAELGAEQTDPLKNDFYTAMFRAPVFSTATITLERYEDCEEWATVALLNEDDTYGTYYPPAIELFSLRKHIVNGFTVDWFKVLNSLGPGHYRIKGTVGSTTYITLPFKLREWSVYGVDGTVRFDWTYKGEQADMNNYQVRTYYGSTGFPAMIRVLGRFGKMTLGYEPTDRDLNTGKTERVRVDITPKYVFGSGRLYYTVHELLGFNAFIADDLKVTDFNVRTQYYDIIQLPVRIAGGYDPNYAHANRKIFEVSVEFQHKNWNLGRGTDKC